jgi:hypothetical protein
MAKVTREAVLKGADFRHHFKDLRGRHFGKDDSSQ